MKVSYAPIIILTRIPLFSSLPLAALVSCSLLPLADAQETVPFQAIETFDFDTGFFGLQRGLDSDGFSFGWSDSNNAGGEAGELGGTFARNGDSTNHYVADANIGSITRNLPLTISGRFVITENLNMDGWIHVGYINRETAAANPQTESQNQIGLAIAEPNDGSGAFRIMAVSNSSAGRVRGNLQRVPVGSKVNFVLTYEPSGNDDGVGTISLTLILDDGSELVSTIAEALAGENNREFDAFIVGSVPASGSDLSRRMIAYVDDLTYTVNRGPRDRTLTFDTDSEALNLAKGNESDGFDFGWSNSNHAGSGAGEVGGTFARTDDASTHYLADTFFGNVWRQDNLAISGRFVITKDANMDGWLHVGYINRESADATPISESQNQLGMAIAEPSGGSAGFRVMAISNSRSGRQRGNPALITLGTQVSFAMVYEPDGMKDGTGSLTLTLTLPDGSELVSLVEEARSLETADWKFDSFIIGGVPASSGDPNRRMMAFFDDITYTIASDTGGIIVPDPGGGGEPEPSSDFFSGVDLGEDWFQSAWFGTYNKAFYPWIFHLQHDWLFLFESGNREEVLLFDSGTGDWWWTTRTHYTSFYSFGRDSWIYYFIDTVNPREFFDLMTGELYSVDGGKE